MSGLVVPQTYLALGVRLLVGPVAVAERVEQGERHDRRRVGAGEPAPVEKAERPRGERQQVDVEEVEEERSLAEDDEPAAEHPPERQAEPSATSPSSSAT